MHAYRQTDYILHRQTDIQTDRQTDTTDRQTDRQTDRHTDRYITKLYKCINIIVMRTIRKHINIYRYLKYSIHHCLGWLIQSCRLYPAFYLCLSAPVSVDVTLYLFSHFLYFRIGLLRALLEEAYRIRHYAKMFTTRLENLLLAVSKKQVRDRIARKPTAYASTSAKSYKLQEVL